ncbi:MAG: sugar fermentation stimulation protein [Candidatus Bathyarchaeota archaeon B23]|nr:MAG: sugar fermentation stimulation protein [Candidatus Bathyarchaeota archaeon B23]
MLFPQPLRRALFKARVNRFLGLAEVDGSQEEVYIPNPGRLQELLRPGVTVYLSENPSPRRKTSFDLVLVEAGGLLVSIDSRIPNRLFVEAMEGGQLREFEGLQIEGREVPLDGSRIDFLLSDGHRRMLVEVKSCTLVEEGVALFPDAPTERGRRHLRSLAERPGGLEAAAVFIIQRGDAEVFRPNVELDPAFAEALREARGMGVDVYAHRCHVTLEGIWVMGEVDVEIPD